MEDAQTPLCSSKRAGTIDNSNADYHKLVNTVERHTRYSPAYCPRKKHDTPAECRFGFPKDLQEETKMFYELLPHNKVGTELVIKRNDPRLNSHN